LVEDFREYFKVVDIHSSIAESFQLKLITTTVVMMIMIMMMVMTTTTTTMMQFITLGIFSASTCHYQLPHSQPDHRCLTGHGCTVYFHDMFHVKGFAC